MVNPRSNLAKTLVSLVLLVYCTGLSSIILPLIEYSIDYHRIASEECENIALPELECHGKCYLTEQITKQTVPESSTTREDIVVQKTGVDPHYSDLNNFAPELPISSFYQNGAPSYESIILAKIDPPPQS